MYINIVALALQISVILWAWGVGGGGEMGGQLFNIRGGGGGGLGGSRKFSGFLFRFIDHEFSFSASDHMAPQPEVIQDASFEKTYIPQKKRCLRLHRHFAR
jgi:hypothetical protein